MWSSEEAQRLWSSCAVAEANNFPFLEPIEDGKYYEFVLIRTDITRGPNQSRGTKTISLLSYLSSFALTMMKSPSAYQLYRLARTRSKIPRIRRRYIPHNVKYKASKHVKTLQNMLRTQTFAQNKWDPQTQRHASLDSQRMSLDG